MDAFKIKNFELVELIINGISGNNQRVYFQQQPQLQSFNLPNQRVYIKGIDTYSTSALSKSPLTSSVSVAAPADILNATLTIVEDTTENKKMIPLARLNNSFGYNGTNVTPQQPLVLFRNLWTVDWTKCYVTLTDQPSNMPFSYLFGVYYSYEPDYEDVMLDKALVELDIARRTQAGLR